MNKKGFLLAEETLKIVIALISISFLIYFLISLYGSHKDSKDLELAKASLQHLIDEIDSKANEVEIYNPSSSNKFPGGWILISFPLNDIKPKFCSNLAWDNCLCICNEGTTTFRDSGLAEDCDSTGFCLETDFIVKNKKIKLETLPIIIQINHPSLEITKK